MHALNISGLATYVNCPEIYQANDHFSASFPRGGSFPDRYVHERRARSGPDTPVSGRSQERCRRRLPRDPSPGSLPLARGPGLARKPRLDRGAEPAHRRLSRGDPRARHDPPTVHEALELSEVRRAVPEGGPLLLPQERRAAESVSPVPAGVARGDPRDAARSEHPLRRRDGGALDAGGWRPRAGARVWPRSGRGGLGGGCGGRRRRRARTGPPFQMDQVLRSVVDEGWGGLFL